MCRRRRPSAYYRRIERGRKSGKNCARVTPLYRHLPRGSRLIYTREKRRRAETIRNSFINIMTTARAAPAEHSEARIFRFFVRLATPHHHHQIISVRRNLCPRAHPRTPWGHTQLYIIWRTFYCCGEFKSHHYPPLPPKPPPPSAGQRLHTSRDDSVVRGIDEFFSN